MKKKFLSKILISVIMMGIFIMPIAPSVKINHDSLDAKISINQVYAANEKKVDPIEDIPSNGLKLNCSFPLNMTVSGCLAWFFWAIFNVTALITKLAAYFLDFFVYYSTNSTSYNSTFISSGWSVIRDVANMFFIIALLYVAIKTILGLNVTDNKKMIGYVIVVALLLNFSLFTTQVVIDGTNILAKVFYNNMPAIDKNGVELDAKSLKSVGGEKSISVGLVSLYDPQKIMTQDMYDSTAGTATFIFLTIIMIALTLYTAYIFFAVAMLFVSRVASLWILMIFSPIAFASYTVPFDIPGFGHKEWWGQLFKNAFLAPIFIFFLYIIVVFASFLKDIAQYPSGADVFQKLMSILIPFIILFVLLMKSKELAIKYSGEMGQAFMKVGQMVGGVAVGALTGGTAIAGRAVLGRVGAGLANSEMVNKMARSDTWTTRKIGLGVRDLGKAAGKASFDVRGIKVAGKDIGSATGFNVNAIGGPKTGGFEKMREDKINKRKRRAEELEVGEYEPKSLSLRGSETNLQKINNNLHKDLEETDKLIEVKRQALKDMIDIHGKDHPETQKAQLEFNSLLEKKDAIKNGEKYKGDLTGEKVKVGTREVEKEVDEEVDEIKVVEVKNPDGTTLVDSSGKAITREEKTGNKIKVKVTEDVYEDARKEGTAVDYEKNGKIDGKSLKDFEKEVREKKAEIVHENQNRRERFAKDIESPLTKAWDMTISLGQYSTLGADKAAHDVRMEMKAPPKEPKEHGGGGGGHGGHGDGGGYAPTPVDHVTPKTDHKEADNHDAHGAKHG